MAAGNAGKPGGGKGMLTLRIVSVAITVMVILVIGSIGYSAYMDYQGVANELQTAPNSFASGAVTTEGQSGVVSINITIPNKGMYTLDVTVSCSTSDPNVVCQKGSVSIPPGQSDTLRFRMTLVNYTEFMQSDKNVRGNVSIQLEPMASLSVGVNLGSLINQGSG